MRTKSQPRSRRRRSWTWWTRFTGVLTALVCCVQSRCPELKYLIAVLTACYVRSSWRELVKAAQEQLARHVEIINNIERQLATGMEQSVIPLQAALAAAADYGFLVEADRALGNAL